VWVLPSAPSDAAAAGDAEDSPDAAQTATMLSAMRTPFETRRDHRREDRAARGDHARADRAAAGRDAGRLNMLSSFAQVWRKLSKGCDRLPATPPIVPCRGLESLQPLTEACQDLHERRPGLRDRNLPILSDGSPLTAARWPPEPISEGFAGGGRPIGFALRSAPPPRRMSAPRRWSTSWSSSLGGCGGRR
jgi:hypothetical protein